MHDINWNHTMNSTTFHASLYCIGHELHAMSIAIITLLSLKWAHNVKGVPQ